MAARHRLESHRDLPLSQVCGVVHAPAQLAAHRQFGAAGAYRPHGSAQMSAFYAAKAGIVAFSKSLAREVDPYGITVNPVFAWGDRGPRTPDRRRPAKEGQAP